MGGVKGWVCAHFNVYKGAVMDKQEIISELYSIRAGLSLISENADIITQSEEKVISLKDEEYKSRKSYREDQSRLEYIRNEKKRQENEKHPLLREREKYECLIAEEKAELNEIPEMAATKSWRRIVPFITQYDTLPTIIVNVVLMVLSGIAVLLLLGIIGTVAFGDDSWSGVIGYDGVEILMKACFFGGMALYPVVVFIIFLIRRKKIIQTISEGMMSDRTKNINRWQIEINNIDATIAKHDEKISELDRQESILVANQQAYTSGLDTVSRNNDAARELCRNVSEYCVKENVRIRDFLANNYNNVLTMADWPNIDLIIFYFDTGRADTMKEALQLVDEQRRNDAIVHAINTAAREISGAIRRNFNSLSQMLSSHFTRINMQLEDASFRIDKLGNELRSATDLMQGQISKLSDASRLQTAFMAKATKTTAELVEDMNRSIDVNVTVNFD